MYSISSLFQLTSCFVSHNGDRHNYQSHMGDNDLLICQKQICPAFSRCHLNLTSVFRSFTLWTPMRELVWTISLRAKLIDCLVYSKREPEGAFLTKFMLETSSWLGFFSLWLIKKTSDWILDSPQRRWRACAQYPELWTENLLLCSSCRIINVVTTQTATIKWAFLNLTKRTLTLTKRLKPLSSVGLGVIDYWKPN